MIMDKGLVNFLRDKQIDSFSKLRFLLFLRQHPRLEGCAQHLAERLYIEAPLVEKLIAELQGVGLLERETNDYILPDEPNLKFYLEILAYAFEQPLARQELLDQIKQRPEQSRGNRLDISSLGLQRFTLA
jgi:hypothetical protein